MQLGQWSVEPEQGPGGDGPQKDHDPRRDQLQLGPQPALEASLDLVGARRTVVGGSALDAARDEDLLSVDSLLLEKLVEEAPGIADEGSALGVLFGARCFTHEHDVGIPWPLAGDCMAPGGLEATLVAVRYPGPELLGSS
jgi:hypothetical protein